MIAIGLVRSRPVSTKLHVTSFKEHGVHRHGTAVSWWIVSIARPMESGIILVDKPFLPIWTEPRKSNQMRYDDFFLDKVYLLYRNHIHASTHSISSLTRLRLMIQPSVVH